MNAHQPLFAVGGPSPEPPPRPNFQPFRSLPDLPAMLTLRARRQFVPWTYSLAGGDLSHRTGEVRPFRWVKKPIDVRTGHGASVSNVETWTDYETAAAYAVEHGCAGLGYVMTADDNLAGGDLDKVRNPVTGALDRWAAELIAMAETYAEVSSSGRGVRIFGFGKPAKASVFDLAQAEVYATGRWLSLTGQHISGTPIDIRPAPETFRRLEERVARFRAYARAEIEAERKASGKDAPRRRPSESQTLNFLQAVDQAAMAYFDAWVPDLFLGLAVTAPNGGYRVSSDALGRDLEEAIGIHPSGIRDWGVADLGDEREGRRTPIGLVKDWLYEFSHVVHAEVTAKDAAFWLCDRLSVTPEDMGWNARKPAEAYFDEDAARAVMSRSEELTFGFRDGSNEPLISEDKAGIQFAEAYRERFRFCTARGSWFVWTDSIWQENTTSLAFHRVREHIRKMAESQPDKVRILAGRAAFAGAVERYARADPAFAVTADIWDRDPYLLGTPGGTVELRTGKLRPSRPADGITRSTAVAPADTASCPIWLRLLEETFAGDAATIRFFCQWCGYSLTGDTREQSLLFGHGNGKGVTLNTVGRITGSYCVTAAAEPFVATLGTRHSTELAMLAGARIVKASETEDGQAWAEKRIKELTGGDEITARFMRRDNFTFLPAFKLTIIGNSIPDLNNVDQAMRRRFNLLPFLYKPARPDPTLTQRLEAEWPAILRWMLDGCLDWQANRLVRPATVLAATQDYFDAQDTFGHWIAEACTVDRGNADLREASVRLFTSWSAHARALGIAAGTEKSFAGRLKQRLALKPAEKIPLSDGKRVRGFSGIALHVPGFENQEGGKP